MIESVEMLACLNYRSLLLYLNEIFNL